MKNLDASLCDLRGLFYLNLKGLSLPRFCLHRIAAANRIEGKCIVPIKQNVKIVLRILRNNPGLRLQGLFLIDKAKSRRKLTREEAYQKSVLEQATRRAAKLVDEFAQIDRSNLRAVRQWLSKNFPELL